MVMTVTDYLISIKPISYESSLATHMCRRTTQLLTSRVRGISREMILWMNKRRGNYCNAEKEGVVREKRRNSS